MPVFEAALDTLRKLGATVVDPADLPSAEEIVTSNNENIVLDTDFKVRFIDSRNNIQFKSLIDPTQRILRSIKVKPKWRPNSPTTDRLQQRQPIIGRTSWFRRQL